jgi:hypothetical protein
MITEKDFEDIICKYPDIIEEGLTFKARQLTLYGRRMNILFEDRFKRKLIIELKAGPIKDQHIDQILSYQSMLLSVDDPTLRVMLVGTRVPPNIKRSLDHYGIAWREISLTDIKEFLNIKKDNTYLGVFEEDEHSTLNGIRKKNTISPLLKGDHELSIPVTNIEREVGLIKASQNYISFRSILKNKIENEALAKQILKENIGRITYKHLGEVFALIDSPYNCYKNGKLDRRPWFGRLLKPNGLFIFNEDLDKVNKWFILLADDKIPATRKLEILRNETYKIRGINAGFITLMLYLFDYLNYSIWFSGQHEALRTFYPELKKFAGESDQYTHFNELAKSFIKRFDFEHAELDWILSGSWH